MWKYCEKFREFREHWEALFLKNIKSVFGKSDVRHIFRSKFCPGFSVALVFLQKYHLCLHSGAWQQWFPYCVPKSISWAKQKPSPTTDLTPFELKSFIPDSVKSVFGKSWVILVFGWKFSVNPGFNVAIGFLQKYHLCLHSGAWQHW